MTDKKVCVIIRWSLVGVWAGLIWYLSGIPHLKTDLGVWDLILRKVAHLAEYGILCILFFRAWVVSCSLDVKKLAWICFFITVGYAITDEFHQSFVPGRYGSPIDVLIDSAGALAGLIIVRKLS